MQSHITEGVVFVLRAVYVHLYAFFIGRVLQNMGWRCLLFLRNSEKQLDLYRYKYKNNAAMAAGLNDRPILHFPGIK